MEKKNSAQKARLIVNQALCEPDVSRLMNRLKNHDEVTFEHCINVAFIATQMGIHQNYSSKRLRILAIGGLLHDIGKLRISENLLNKETPLSPAEFGKIKEHSEFGYELIKNMNFAADIKQIVRYHHERLDGSGYPCGLTREAIPIGVRFISVADVYDAMTAKRTYKKEFSGQYAIEELQDPFSLAYDSSVVNLLLKCRDR